MRTILLASIATCGIVALWWLALTVEFAALWQVVVVYGLVIAICDAGSGAVRGAFEEEGP